MPEGPEVQQVLNSLEPKILEKVITSVDVFHQKITIPLKNIGRQNVEIFSDRLEGSKIRKLERKGKYLIFHCEQADSSTIYMVSHLGMTGAFFNVNTLEEIAPNYRKHIHLQITLKDKSILVYSDQRRFGWIGALTAEEYMNYTPVQKVGPDPSSPTAPQMFLYNIRRKTLQNKPIKKVIMMPEIIQGVGNIYAAECLFRARIHPLTPVGKVTDEKLLVLLSHIKDTFELAINMGGSSIRNYVNSEGIKGTFQELHMVYNKKSCPECGRDIDNVKIDGRSSFFCPHCQKD
ncbi:bifunctional DNA-formamidopyrimidine glycosylase/DNA-(apurinic or apyrimidinic site) lyase [Robertmurraya massiliosenegalensis]|uniref:bifunctional DNA-formamidopyrimidine glycosylase/DNA-(apurinic or apyrimidinic site) lyase n=1 Tax=Robertmurraya TaxID=2837507 RepID=UPI0039A40F60